MSTLLYLIAGHYLADFALQNDFMAKNKVPDWNMVWMHVMTAHCAMQAATVLLVTNRIELAIGEFIAHFTTDVLKCRGAIGLTTDQFIHISFRVLWWVLL